MPNKTLQFESFGITEIGLVRELNEDYWASYPDAGLFILADGMGGHSAGEIASKDAVEFLYSYFKKNRLGVKSSLEKVKDFFKQAFSQVNAWIYEKAEKNEKLKGMGTTLCSLYFHQQNAVIAHVGDSRIYLFRNQRLQPLTEDHSLVSELLSLGAMDQEEVETFPFKHILTRAIGTHADVEASITCTSVEPSDIFLLCSDGLTNYASETRMEDILKTQKSLSSKATALVDLAMSQGGGDNITLILVAPSA